MKKNLLFIISLILVAASIAILVLKNSSFGKNNTSFSAKPKREITRIVFNSEGEELILENRNGKWILNGGLETRKSSINHVLHILKEMAIKSPVSTEMFDTAVTRNSAIPVRVKVYESRKLLSDFLVYKTRSNIYGNIMKKSERAKPFIVYVPGHDGDIGSAFTMNELYWQPYTIFNLLPSEITSVSFENLSDQASSFSILKNNEEYTLTDGKITLPGWDAGLVKRYLSYFTFIPFEAWALDLSEAEKETILSEEPAYRITVKTSDGTNTMLSLWERIKPDGTLDSDRLYGRTGTTKAIFIVRYFDIDPILKKREYFFTAP